MQDAISVKGWPMKNRLPDEIIAQALELHIGDGLAWKVVARQMGIDHAQLRSQVGRAKADGMLKFLPNKSHYRGLKLAAAMQRQRLARMARPI